MRAPAGMFRSLLIANRGEIAVRIARTARRMGIETIAVHSDADARALHVAACDRALRLGPAPPRESYLSIPRLLQAAERAGAAAIHPGYGFLSENPDFAEACAAAGLIFVGPPAAAMRAMGSKSAAKARMQAAGVPVLAGYHGAEQDPRHLAAEAARTGFPVLIKAVAGGGGRGMRVVTGPADFAAALAAARQEAAGAFGDDRVLIERYLTAPRHIEVQVFADTHANAVHLFERDCSAQRRHQKVIEEAPAPGLDPAHRAAMGAAAVACARAVGYVGAGTVEFVTEGDGFWFLEMNTRLQVEHPVTEMITGFDLVEWQLRIAAGEALPVAQAAISVTGHAIEARLCAEDPVRDFAPAIGRIAALALPDDAPGLRVDRGVRAGDTIGVHYDSLLAKVICHGPTRAEALALLGRALAASAVVGIACNLDLLGRILRHPDFAAGGIDTGFIARAAAVLLAPSAPPPPEVLAAAALALLADEDAAAIPDPGDPHSPWQARDLWWSNLAATRELGFVVDGTPCPVQLAPAGTGWRIAAGGRVFAAASARRIDPLHLAVSLDGVSETLIAAGTGAALLIRRGGESWNLVLADPAAAAATEEAGGLRLLAPIPGQVTELRASPGRTVARGEVLVVLEAMKTVFRLTAPAAATIAEILCAPGETVQEGQVLVRFVEPEAAGGIEPEA